MIIKFLSSINKFGDFPGGTSGEEPASAGDITDMFNRRWERSSGGEHSNPLHYSCLESPMDRGAWWSTVHRVAKSQT